MKLIRLLGWLPLVLLGPNVLPLAAAEQRPAVAVCRSEPGSLLARQAPGQPWKVLRPEEGIPPEVQLVGLRLGTLQSKNGAVTLTFLADLSDRSPLPIKEGAVVLHQDPAWDLSFTLDRGRVDLVHTGKKGPARVRFQVRQRPWEITLKAPGTRVAVELYSRWPAGVPFRRKPSPEDVPVANLVLVVVKGEIMLDYGERQYTMTAPPGPAEIQWDSDRGLEIPVHLDRAPLWTEGEDEADPKVQEKLRIIEKFRKLAAEKSVAAAMEEFARSPESSHHRMALKVIDTGIVAMRNWIGRGPGQDLKLYHLLIEKAGFSPVHAATVLQLLHSPGEDQLARPETYEMLIDFLAHEKLAIRDLAYWHLVRLVPAGKAISYDPLGSREDFLKAIQEWKKLIPPGTLPARRLPEKK